MHIHIGLPNLPATLCYHGYAYGVAPGNEQNNDGQTYWGELVEATVVPRYPVCYHGYEICLGTCVPVWPIPMSRNHSQFILGI